MGDLELIRGLAESHLAMDQADVDLPQAGPMPSPPRYRHPHEPSVHTGGITCNNDDNSNVHNRHKGRGNRPGRRGALKCARCRKQKRGEKVGHYSISNLIF
jgi:hypothetical protein